MKTKHAPGPWEARRELGDWVIRRANTVYADDLVKIADVNHGRMDDEANAALIAAAPELLAALKNLMHETDDGTQLCGREFATQAHAAIAKATCGNPITDNSDGLDAKLTASLPAMIADVKEAP